MNLENIKILVVEDESSIREILCDEFEMSGAIVTQASNGIEAISKMENSNFDIIFSDIRMPQMDGIELAIYISQKISKDKPKIYFCSGYSDLDPVEASEIGVKKVFPKPFDMLTIIEKLFNDLKTNT